MYKKGRLTSITISTLSFICFLYILLASTTFEGSGINDDIVQALASLPPTNDSNVVGLNSINNTVINYLTYVNPTFGFKIDYPSGWSYQQYDIDPLSNETIHTLVDITPPISEDPNVVTNFYVGIEELQDLPSLDIYAKNGINGYRSSNQNFSLVSVAIGNNSSNADLTLSGKPSYQIVFTDSANGIQRKSIDRGILDEYNKRSYWLIFNTDISKYDKLLPVVQRMIESFELNNTISEKPQGNDTQSGTNAGFVNNSTNSTQSFLVYSNPQLGVKLEYPAYAKIQEYEGYTQFNTSVGYTFSIGAYPATVQRIDNQYIQDQLEYSKGMFSRGFELISSEATTLSGHPAHSITFKFIGDGGESLTERDVYSIVGETEYLFIISSLSATYNVDLPIFDRVLNSLELSGRPENVGGIDSQPQNITSTTFEEYSNPAGFNITYPAGSEVEENQNVVFFTIPEIGQSTAGAFVDINKQLNQLLKEKINHNNNTLQDFELIKSEELNFAEHAGHTIEYEFTINDGKFVGKEVFTIVDNTEYIFVFKTGAANIENATPIMNRMLDSFEITQSSLVNQQILQESQGISTLNFLPYRHPTLGFTIDYPEAPGLDVDELDVGVSFPHSKGTYHVLVSGNIGKSLDEFASDLTQSKAEEDYPDLKLIDQTSATVAGHPAIRTEYTYTTTNQVPIHALEYALLFDGDAYVLSFNTAYPTNTALDDFRAVVQKMLDSFQFPQSGSSVGSGDVQEQTTPGAEGFGSSGSGGFGQEDDGEDGSDTFGQSPDEQDDQDQNGGFGSEGPQSPSEQDGEGGFNPFE
jgi:hypothetical protein